MDKTVVYYTSNRETDKFEGNIRNKLLETIGDLPLVSVSQKPLDFGENICVGDVGVSEINKERQLLVGAKAAKTKFIYMAEADFIYPKEYFEFKPPSEKAVFLAMPVYVLFAQRGKMRIFSPKPRGSEGAMIVGRDYIINKIELMLKGKEMWRHWQEKRGQRDIPHLLAVVRRKWFNLKAPVVTFKTDYQMHRKTPHDIEKKLRILSPWGTSHGLIAKYEA